MEGTYIIFENARRIGNNLFVIAKLLIAGSSREGIEQGGGWSTCCYSNWWRAHRVCRLYPSYWWPLCTSQNKKGNGGKCLLNGLHELAVLVELVALLLQSLSRGHAAHGLFLLLLSLGDQSWKEVDTLGSASFSKSMRLGSLGTILKPWLRVSTAFMYLC